jgi:CBS domain-containing protein
MTQTDRTQDYPSLRGRTVGEAMHRGLISCPADASLRDIARMMATYRVHAILVTRHGAKTATDGRGWAIVSDEELVRTAAYGDLDERTAGDIASPHVLTVSTCDALHEAAGAWRGPE